MSVSPGSPPPDPADGTGATVELAAAVDAPVEVEGPRSSGLASRPEVALGGAFAGGLLLALILRRVRS